jgi:hypothetical protein
MKRPEPWQGGQAMAEGVLALAALAAFWIAVSWLYRVQDIALSAQDASSFLAFAAAKGDMASSGRIEPYFPSRDHQWNDLAGRSMLPERGAPIGVEAERLKVLRPDAQPGGAHQIAAALRKEWRLEDAGVLDVRLRVTPGAAVPGSLAPAVQFDAPLALQRNTAILTFAGHASNDQHVQHVLAGSASAWGQGASASYGLSRRISAAMAPVDAGWGRAAPQPEWLLEWAGDVPPAHLQAMDQKE